MIIIENLEIQLFNCYVSNIVPSFVAPVMLLVLYKYFKNEKKSNIRTSISTKYEREDEYVEVVGVEMGAIRRRNV